jgi:hypothetical protein
LHGPLTPFDLDSVEHDKKDLFGILKNLIRHFPELRSIFNQKLFTFLIFVVIAAGFWFVRSLGEEYEAEVTYPVRYINFPDQKILIGKVPNQLRLKVRANGFSILKSKLNLNLIPLKFDVNSFSLNSIGTDTFYILTSTVRDILSEELDQVKILAISPDTLFFRFTDLTAKKVGIRPVLEMSDKFFHKQFMMNGEIRLEPDSIIISGPASRLSTIDHINTRLISYTNLMDTVRDHVELKPEEMITYSQNKVRIIIPVDRFTEVEENIPVKSINVPDTVNMVVIPGQVGITYRICLSNYEKIKSNPLVAKIDYNQIGENQKTRLTVFLSDTPRFIRNIRFSPGETEYLISRK